MRISVLGTGIVGQTLCGAFAGLGHDVVMGTRNVDDALARTDAQGRPALADWLAAHPGVRLAPLAEAGEHGEVVVNATSGDGSVAALEGAGEHALVGKVVVDVANPLDFSQGFPPSLFVCNTDSLAEQIQRRFPEARVVKTLNTVNASVMVDPGAVAGGEHTMFLAGDDAPAKATVTGLLRALGWADLVDLGGISAARAMEMYLPLWLHLMGVVGHPAFSIKVAR